MSDDQPEPQAILPGFRRELGYPPKDWRKWTDGRGTKIDAPKWRGRTSYDFSKTVPMPVDKHGEPIRRGDFQVLRRTDRMYVVCDWAKPLGEQSVYLAHTFNRAANVCVWFHMWRRWQGPIREGRTRANTVFPKGFPL